MPKKLQRGAVTPLQQVIEGVQPLAETVWSNLAGIQSPGAQTRILFTSTEERAGTSLITAASALGLARNTRSEVTVVEAHLRRPAMAAYLGTDPVPGLSDLLVGQVNLDRCRRAAPGCPGLHVIAGGTPRHVIAGEFAAEGATEMFRLITRQGRYVLFDAPPILDHPESRALLRHVDGVVLVLRARSSRKATAKKTTELLEDEGVELYGSVLNRYKSELPFVAEQ